MLCNLGSGFKVVGKLDLGLGLVDILREVLFWTCSDENSEMGTDGFTPFVCR